MTRKERQGLELLIDEAQQYVLPTAEVKAAMDWIKRQISIDNRRRRKKR